MVFSSLEFLFFFFPLVFIIYFFINPRYANLMLLMASLLFYYLGDKEHMRLLISVIAIAYLGGALIQKYKNIIVKKFILSVSLFLMLGMMAYYKYLNFMVENVNEFLNKNIETREIVLPIGISFFIFQAISYVIDIYRGEGALKNPIDMALYISFFPQLIAGPIIRFHDISEYMDRKYREINIENVENGIWRFSVGISKKVLLANNLGGLADIVFSVNNIKQCSVLYTWLGAIAYTLQIYYDFSGYSDMAIGLGEIFGFKFQENFNFPYAASSIKDFWRRWHISLSQFFRDYVYIPLGGNRCSIARRIFNMLLVWFLTGLWHGASWNYIIWGLAYGFILLIERKTLNENRKLLLIDVLGHIYTMISVIFLWVVFRTNDLMQAKLYITNMLGIGASSIVDGGFIFQVKNFAVLIIIAVVFCIPVPNVIKNKIGEKGWFQWIKAFMLVCCMVASVSYIYMGSYNPFLYFMF